MGDVEQTLKEIICDYGVEYCTPNCFKECAAEAWCKECIEKIKKIILEKGNCKNNPVLSSICILGTKGCEVEHDL